MHASSRYGGGYSTEEALITFYPGTRVPGYPNPDTPCVLETLTGFPDIARRVSTVLVQEYVVRGYRTGDA